MGEWLQAGNVSLDEPQQDPQPLSECPQKAGQGLQRLFHPLGTSPQKEDLGFQM